MHESDDPGSPQGTKTFDIMHQKWKALQSASRKETDFDRGLVGKLRSNAITLCCLQTTAWQRQSCDLGLPCPPRTPEIASDFLSSSLMGSLSKVFLRKVCGNSAESSRKFAKNTFYCVRKGCRNSAESCGNLRKISAMTLSRTTPYVNC